jgi:rRNA maturation RNase YbeY
MSGVHFFSQQLDFKISHPRKITSWIRSVVNQENRSIYELNFIFCSDDALLDINRNYLQHDYYTDIITFDNSEGEDLEGDIFISIDRVRENAERLKVGFEIELNRVIIHGVLHLIGYKDKSTKDKIEMRRKEDFYLSLS